MRGSGSVANAEQARQAAAQARQQRGVSGMRAWCRRLQAPGRVAQVSEPRRGARSCA